MLCHTDVRLHTPVYMTDDGTVLLNNLFIRVFVSIVIDANPPLPRKTDCLVEEMMKPLCTHHSVLA